MVGDRDGFAQVAPRANTLLLPELEKTNSLAFRYSAMLLVDTSPEIGSVKLLQSTVEP